MIQSLGMARAGVVLGVGLVVVACSIGAAAAANRELRVQYSELIETAAVTHSGRTVGAELRVAQVAQEWAKLVPPKNPTAFAAAQRARLALVEPFLESRAFVLDAALVRADPKQARPLIEVADLFRAGDAQPAWADLLLTRHFVVLSDGRGYVRVFLPGGDAKGAFDAHYGTLRHVLNWVRASVPGLALDVDVFAYENSLAETEFTLKLEPHKVAVAGDLPVKLGLQPLDLEALDKFFASGVTPEAARVDGGQLYLVGARTGRRPTLDGYAVTAADLAVAYRAARYRGLSEVYMSLDSTGVPETAAVNYGGRLADTRIGQVTLRCDQRLKTIASGVDPHAHSPVADQIRRTIPTFSAQTERMLGDPEGRKVSSEGTRFWFYPDKTAVERAGDQVLRIVSPRYTAAAERTDAGGVAGKRADRTPAWTTGALKHFNSNYDLFGKLFPELLELDDAGRLLLLGTWLADLQARGRLPFDADGLLAVQLPPCATPRTVPQMLVGYAVDDGQPPTILSADVSHVAEEMGAARRDGRLGRAWERRGLFAADSRPVFDMDYLAAGIESAGRPALRDAAKHAGVDAHRLRNFERFQAVTGGLSLDLRAKLRDGGPIGDGELRRLKGTGDLVTGGGGRGGGPPAPPTGHAVPAPDPGKRGRHTVSRAGGILVVDAVGEGGKPGSQSVRPDSPNSDRPSRSVYWSENGPTFGISENGATLNYRLDSPDSAPGTFVAVRAGGSPRSAEADAAVAFEAMAVGKASHRAWRVLAEGTPVVAIGRLADGSPAVLSRDPAANSRPELRIHKDGQVTVIAGPQAEAKLREAARQRAAGASTPEVQFLHVEPAGDAFGLTLGNGGPVKTSAADLDRLLADPTRQTEHPLDAVFRRPDGPKDVIVYRGALDGRPERFGGSLRKARPDEPLRLAAALGERYHADGVRVHLDDDPAAATRRLRTLPPVQDGGIALLIREDAYRSKDRSVKRREDAALDEVRAVWTAAGLKVVERIEDAHGVGNIGVVSGVNSADLFDYLQRLGEAGQLKDRVWILLTCGEPGNSNMFHELLDQYDAKAFLTFPEQLDPLAVAVVLRRVPEVLAAAKRDGAKLTSADLIHRAAEAAEQDKDHPPSGRLKKQLRLLRRGLFQLSDGRTPGRSAPTVTT